MDALVEILGDSPAIVGLRDQVRQILKAAGTARRPAPLLIRGETGTGKGLIARTVHRAGPRASGPFVEVNCAAIPEHLLEAELFGYERGAFYSSLGRACLGLGRLDDAQRLADRAVELLPPRSGFAVHAWHLLGDIATHPDRFEADSAEAHYRKALALAEPRGMRPVMAHCHLGLGKLYRRTGDGAKAHEHLATATTMYREMGMTFWLEKAEVELAGS